MSCLSTICYKTTAITHTTVDTKSFQRDTLTVNCMKLSIWALLIIVFTSWIAIGISTDVGGIISVLAIEHFSKTQQNFLVPGTSLWGYKLMSQGSRLKNRSSQMVSCPFLFMYFPHWISSAPMAVALTECWFLNLFNLIWRERERERNICHLLVDFPNAYKSRSGARLKPGVRKSICASHMGCRDPTIWHQPLLTRVFIGSCNCEYHPNLNQDTQIWIIMSQTAY